MRFVLVCLGAALNLFPAGVSSTNWFFYVFTITQTADEKRISSSKLEILSNIYTLR